MYKLKLSLLDPSTVLIDRGILLLVENELTPVIPEVYIFII